MTTGTTYQGTGATQGHFTDVLRNGLLTETFVNNFRIIGQGRGDNLLLHTVTHLTINANGDVTADHEITSMECR